MRLVIGATAGPVVRRVGAIVVGLLCATRSEAQVYEAVGTRAQGLGGAFVAVADDATAAWWNPAGLATGAYFNVVIERGRTTEPADPARDVQSTRLSSGGFAAAFPALGLSYYRLRTSAIAAAAPTGAAIDGRQDLETAGRAARSVQYSQFGATVGQSLGDHLVIGSTVKLLRAGSEARTLANDASLDNADDMSVPVRTKVGLDLGAMVAFPNLRVGLGVRNLREVNVGTDDQPLSLTRQVRAGVALLAGSRGVLDGITVAADADLTRTDTAFGEVRHLATGAEAWLLARHVGLRGGVSINSVGERRPVTSFGGSVAPLTGIFVDAAWSRGRDRTLEGWTASLRLTF